jgi:DNA-binding CsgD family transcriptional regulator
MARGVIGREEELGSVRAFLEQVRAGPAALVLSGEPGIGKTVLWDAGVEGAGRFGRVLSCRGVESEASLAFAGLSELVAGVLEDVLPALALPRRRALEVALLLAEPGERAPDAHAIGLALLDVLHVLAERSPVVVAVDDVQWLDPSSAGVLQVALRRVREERIGFLTTVRRSPDVRVPFDVEGSFPEERLTELSLDVLDLDTLGRLLGERLGLELTRPELSRVQEATAGNPFFALEIGRELVRAGERPAPGRALRLPDSLQELLGGRLARLPADARDVLLLAAADGRPTVEVIAAAHGERDAVLRALGLAAREGVVVLEGSQVRFAHPLLASVCYEQAPLWDRHAVHRALAGAVSDVEERARHLALASDGPDAAVAAELDAAAQHAAGRGASAAAAELCELAAGLTPAEAVEGSRRRRLQAAQFHLTAGAGGHARAMLEPLLEEVPPGVERADVLLALATSMDRVSPHAVISLLEEAIVEAAGDDTRSAQILGTLSAWRLNRLDVAGAVAPARAALERAERVGDPALLADALRHVGYAETMALDVTPGLLERGVAIEEALETSLRFRDSPGVTLGMRLTCWDDPDRARDLLEQARARAVAQGDEVGRAYADMHLSFLELYAGRWPEALEHAVAMLELAEQMEADRMRGLALHHKALVETHLGRVEQARSDAEESLAIAQAASDDLVTIIDLGVLGSLELALGNPEAAGEYLRELPGRLLSAGWNDVSSTLWADTIEVLIALGELEQARSYLAQYEERAQRTSRRARAIAARYRGLLAAAEGDLEGASEAFARALVEHEGSPYPFERGRTLLCLGVVRRQAKQKRLAREALEQALAIFEELGARLWAEKARAELRRISGRRPASTELTETEERVARLAAEGRANKVIASELFMSVHTVEAHLTRVYRKLGIHSRGELAARLAMWAGGAAKQPETTVKQ